MEALIWRAGRLLPVLVLANYDIHLVSGLDGRFITRHLEKIGSLSVGQKPRFLRPPFTVQSNVASTKTSRPGTEGSRFEVQ